MLDAPQPRKIAIVDDDECVRESIVGLMESVGHDVAFFRSAEEFLSFPGLFQFACLIIDVRLPGISGLQLYCRLVAGNARVPAVFITAHGDRSIEERALAAGAKAFLYKPFQPEVLLQAIRDAVANAEEGNES